MKFHLNLVLELLIQNVLKSFLTKFFIDLDTPFGYKDFQPYRVNMNEGFTLGVRSCTAGIVTAKNKVAPLFMHLFNL